MGLNDLRELGEVVIVQIRNRPIRHSTSCPMDKVASAFGESRGAAVALTRRGPDEKIDEVLLVLINQSGHRAVRDVIEPSSDEREVERRQVMDKGGKVYFS